MEIKIINEADHYVLCFQKVVDMLNILMNVSICLAWLKMGGILRSGSQDMGKGYQFNEKAFDSELEYNEKYLKTKDNTIMVK